MEFDVGISALMLGGQGQGKDHCVSFPLQVELSSQTVGTRGGLHFPQAQKGEACPRGTPQPNPNHAIKGREGSQLQAGWASAVPTDSKRHSKRTNFCYLLLTAQAQQKCLGPLLFPRQGARMGLPAQTVLVLENKERSLLCGVVSELCVSPQ